MSHGSHRNARRIPFRGRARLRGICGVFRASVRDISRRGVRVRVAREELHLADDADLATAAATVQTRVGSRFVVELGGLQRADGVPKAVHLVRLVLGAEGAPTLDLGCQFDEPLSRGEVAALELAMPEMPARPRTVRRADTWPDASHAALDPGVTDEKVRSLFGVADEARRRPQEQRAADDLRAILTAGRGLTGSDPLVCEVASLTPGTILVRVPGSRVMNWIHGRSEISAAARAVQDAFGDWPELEIVRGTRRVWRGSAHVAGLELGDVPLHPEVHLRLAFGRLLQPAELGRLCAAG